MTRIAAILALTAAGLFGCAAPATTGLPAQSAKPSSVPRISARMQACVDGALRRNPDLTVLAEAVTRFDEGCRDGDPAACSLLGVMLERGLAVPQDESAARNLYNRACEAGNEIACAHLAGVSASFGFGTPQLSSSELTAKK